MSYQITQPSTNPDKVGRFAVSPGTPDYVITFPNESGEVATTADIQQGESATIYPLLNTYTDYNNTNPQPVTEWDIPIVQGRVYRIEYLLFGECETTILDASRPSNTQTNIFNIYMFYQTSSLSQQLNFFGNGGAGTWNVSGSNYDMTTELKGLSSYTYYNSSAKVANAWSVFVFEAMETGTLRHIFQNSEWTSGMGSSSFFAGKSQMKVSLIS